MNVWPIAIDLPQLRRDARAGRVSVEHLLDLIEQLHARDAALQRTIQGLRRERQQLRERLAQYEPAVQREAAAAPAASYSVEAEEKRRGRRRRKKSPGRRRTELKFADAQRTENIPPDGVRPQDCQLVRERAVWRIEQGRAVRVGYRIFAGLDGQEPRIPGVTPRCEYGIEILVVLAYLVYIIGISLDKACAVLGFFCQLPLRKSQADALLRQLARHWEHEFDLVAELIAHAAVVYMDETGWKIGNQNCSLWSFATQCQRLFLFGCRKDDATLDQVLPPEVFDGVGVSDNAAVYCGRFSQGQKCWAHLLRKAIKLALLHPRKQIYRRFLDQLLQCYRDAKRSAADGRLGDNGRRQRVDDLFLRLFDLCRPYRRLTPAKPHEHDFANLIDELLRLASHDELFTFVRVPGVEPTNNVSERLLRGPAQDRKAGRTNQTAAGARRRSIIVSVLESLRASLKSFTFASVVDEVRRWLTEGVSLFARQWQARQAELATANTS